MLTLACSMILILWHHVQGHIGPLFLLINPLINRTGLLLS